jgi:polyhydroxyalkanoate synthesis regulator phasin
MSNKNFFENWMETQQEFMNNWMETSKKMQDAIAAGKTPEEGTKIYNEWLNKQNELTRKAAEATTGQVTEAFKSVNDKQKSGVEEWSAKMNEWMKQQQDSHNKMNDMFRNWSNSFTGNSWMNDSMKQMEQMRNQWMNAFNQPNNSFAPFMNFWNDATTKNAWFDMNNMNQGYARFVEMWQPFAQAMTKNNIQWDQLNQYFRPEMFKDMLDKNMAFLSPNFFNEQMQQINHWNDMANNYNRHAYEQWVNAMPENMRGYLPQYNSFAAPNTANYFQKMILPVIRLVNPGKETEVQENMAAVAEKAGIAVNKIYQFQQHLYTTGTKAWESFITENYELFKNGTDMSNTQEVYKKWIATAEEAYTRLFQSDAYSALQGELLDLQLEIKQHNDKVAEAMMQNLPVVLRSEADDLYATIYELRKRVYALEKQLNGEAAEAKEVKTSKKKAATA